MPNIFVSIGFGPLIISYDKNVAPKVPAMVEKTDDLFDGPNTHLSRSSVDRVAGGRNPAQRQRRGEWPRAHAGSRLEQLELPAQAPRGGQHESAGARAA